MFERKLEISFLFFSSICKVNSFLNVLFFMCKKNRRIGLKIGNKIDFFKSQKKIGQFV